MGTSCSHISINYRYTMKYSLVLLLGVFHSSQAVCFINSCSKWWGNAKQNSIITGACAVLFDENCCDTGDTNLVIKKGESGKFCGTFGSLNPLSSCKGPRFADDVESLAVMPGCTLEVWDHDDGLKDQLAAEKVSFNEGSLNSAKDTYNRNKITLSAKGSPNWINQLSDDFGDMNEDIDSYRCTC